MNENNDIDIDDSNSIMIRLKQILEKGKVFITNETISVSYQFSDRPSPFAKEITEYKRTITYDELLSLDSAINLLKNSNKIDTENIENIETKPEEKEKNKLYKEYQDCFAEARKIQKKIQDLHKFGKTFVYEGYLFFDLNKEKTSLELDTLISNFSSAFNIQHDHPDCPPFLTLNNLLYFGSLLQRKRKEKIKKIIEQMFPNSKIDFAKSYEEAIKDEYIIDPIKSSIKLFSSIYKELSPYIKYQENATKINFNQYKNEIFRKTLTNLQEKLLSYFYNHNFLVIKVDTPVEIFHVLRIVVVLLYNEFRSQYFYENFFCYENSNIQSYFSDFERNKGLQTQYSFIIHPEFLSAQNQNILKELIVSRMTPIPNMELQKFVIITSSSKFIYGKEPDNLTDKEAFKFGEASMKINSNLLQEYYNNQVQQFHFSFQICQSPKAGYGKSTSINNQIEEKIKNCNHKFQVFHHFITDGNQQIPIESFNCTSSNNINIIHFQFNDEIMKQGIKFWSHLYQLYFNGFVLPTNGEPFLINNLGNNFVFFEIPQIRKDHQPLQPLSEFPLPISLNSNESSNDVTLDKMFPQINVLSETKYESTKGYYLFGIKSVVDRLKELPTHQINNLKEFIEQLFCNFFKKDEAPEISFRKLGYIEKYLHKYTKLYINSISVSSNDKAVQDHFIAFFYLLTVSSFYAYNYLPNENNSEDDTLHGYGLTFVTVNDLFCDHVKNCQKKIHFYTTKSKDDLFHPLNNFSFEIQDKYFNVCYEYKGESPLAKDVLKNIFCSSKDYDAKIVQPFKEKNPQSYISRTQMTLPTLFRSSILLSRIFLSQPIILSGDTGCGKTSSLMLLFEYFKLPINDKMYFLNIEIGKTLNCHGGITIEDVKKHLNEAPTSSKKHIIFFDELNTSPASSYIEHLLLNGYYASHVKFVFIGALNPWKKKNPISANLTKVGLTQYIKGEEEKINLIEDSSKKKSKKTPDNISDMMYHVHRPQESTQDIIFDFNPICYEDEYEKNKKFYPDEEKESIHLIIDNLAPQKGNNKLKNGVDICITFIRRLMNERAVISYRDIERTMLIYNELYKYIYNHCNDNQKFKKDLPMITVIISFVLRLPNKQEFKEEDLDKKEDDQKCSEIFKSCFNYYFPKGDEYGSYEKGDKYGSYKINSRDKLISLLKSEFGDIDQIKKEFMTFVYQYTLKYLKKRSIWKFQSTFIHIFIMDICIRCKLPCFIIGMPGTSKSYAVELLKEQNGKNLYVSTYMSSRTSSPDGIKSQYYDAIYKEISNNLGEKKNCSCVVFIDEMGNANINPSRPLKFLHGILDHGLVLNETGYSTKVATIGVSNYTMDFANMNRGVLVYTGLPDLKEILTVFAIESDKKSANMKTTDSEKFIKYREEINLDGIKKIFDYLWPNGMPKTIALRSIYNMRYLIDNKKFDVHAVCRILRELFNSKRLNDSGNYKELMNECPNNVIRGFSAKSTKINNLVCFLERVACKDTQSHKSLSLFTKNYEAIEYFNLFLDDDFIKFLKEQFRDLITLEEGMFKNFAYHLFAEDFKQSPDQISQYALNKIIECISSQNKNVLFIGNHPCFDSCLDLLNVPYGEDQLKRDVIIGSGFSSKFKLTNTDFYIMMIANIDDLPNISKSDNLQNENPFSFAFLDRTETVYLDWEMIGEYYLKYKNMEVTKDTIQQMSKILDEHANYGERSNNFLSSIQSLYNEYRNNDESNYKFENECLQELIKNRWKNGIKSVILTKSKLMEDIYLPEFNKKSIIIEINSNIQDFEQLEKSIKELQGPEKELQGPEKELQGPEKELQGNERLIVIKCSKFDKLHFAHLKSFFDSISDLSSAKIKYNIFIIYYGLDPNKFKGLSTFRWPIFAMEDISIHPELESNKNSKTNCKQLKNSEIEEIKNKLNNMNDYKEKEKETEKCDNFLHNIFKEIIEFTRKDISERQKNKNDDDLENKIKENYEKSEFAQFANLFDNISNKFEAYQNKKYFDIKINFAYQNPKDFKSSSAKSQLISQVYQKLCEILQPFILFRFGSALMRDIPNISNIEDYLLKSLYLDLPFGDFLKKSENDVFYYLFIDYFEFLLKNEISFDSDMIKRKSIADRLICAIRYPTTIVNEIFYNLSDISNCAKKINKEKNPFKKLQLQVEDKNPIYLQQYIDYFHFRSIAGLNIISHQTNCYWDTYLNYCIFSNQNGASEDSADERRVKKRLNNSAIIKSIIDYRNKSIFEIFVLPIESDPERVFKADICKKLIEFNFETTLEKDGIYKIFKEFNESSESLKSENRINELKKFAPEENQEILLQMDIPYAISKWDGDQKSYLTISKSNDYDRKLEYENIKKYDLTNLKEHYKNFGQDWEKHYKNLEWGFKGDCLIDEIQSILNKGSTENNKDSTENNKGSTENNKGFREWLFSGFNSDEPLAIIAFRRYLTSQDEYEADFAKVLDPFFGDVRIIKQFIYYIKDKIPENNSFPIGKITDDNERICNDFSYHNIYKISAKNELFKFNSSFPYLSQFVWFHVAFNKPSDYPLTTLFIQKSAFFIDFQVVPKIIYSIVHLRHIFSYNQVFIPIILHCTSLFDDCECKLLLYDLNYFDTPTKEFENIQKELKTFKEFLQQNYSKSYEKLLKQSSYDQLEFILKIYYEEYNNIVENIYNIIKSKESNQNNFKEEIVNACDILPHMLLTNATLTNFLLPILHETEFKLYDDVENKICRIFTEAECIKSFDKSNKSNKFPLFKVSFEKNFKDKEAEVDFLGFSKIGYQNLFEHYLDMDIQINELKDCGNESLKFHASILSFFLYIYLDKTDDYISNYDELKEDIKVLNDISKCHLNTYSNNNNVNNLINYDLKIKELDVENNNYESDAITIYYKKNEMYPLQGIFKLLPKELKEKIRRYQKKDEIQIIQSEEGAEYDKYYC